jgi:hypothetical protein
MHKFGGPDLEQENLSLAEWQISADRSSEEFLSDQCLRLSFIPEQILVV